MSASTCRSRSAVVRCLRTASGSYSTAADRNGRACSTKSGNRRTRGSTKPSTRCSHSRRPASSPSLHKPAACSKGLTRRTSSSGFNCARYCALNQSSFSGSNTAAPPLMPPSENAAINSSRDITSRSPPGDHPSSARKFIIAWGRYPNRSYSVTDVIPCRLLSFFLSVPRINGTCANSGGVLPSARHRRMCFGVFEM